MINYWGWKFLDLTNKYIHILGAKKGNAMGWLEKNRNIITINGQFWYRLLSIVIRCNFWNPLVSGIVDPIGSLIGIWFHILWYVLPSNACLLEFVIAIGFEMLACKAYKREKNNGGFFKMLHYQPQEMECFLLALVDGPGTDATSTMNHIPNLERHVGSYGVIRYDDHPQSRQCYKKTTNKLCNPQLRAGCGPLENGHQKNMKPWWNPSILWGSIIAPEWTHHHKPTILVLDRFTLESSYFRGVVSHEDGIGHHWTH